MALTLRLPSATTPAAPAVARVDYAKIHMDGAIERWGACRRCDLCKTRTNLVFGGGNPNAPIMIIGGPINSSEDKSGTTMFGGGYGVLSSILYELKLAPHRDIYATNITKCMTALDASSAEYKRFEPTDSQLEACRPILEAQIKIVNPAILVIHGRAANQALLNDPRPLSKYIGHTRKYGERCIALSTHNPAGLVRGERVALQPEYRAHWFDLAEKLNMLGRIWRPDAQLFKDGWGYSTVTAT